MGHPGATEGHPTEYTSGTSEVMPWVGPEVMAHYRVYMQRLGYVRTGYLAFEQDYDDEISINWGRLLWSGHASEVDEAMDAAMESVFLESRRKAV